MSMVWPTLGSRTAKEQEQVQFDCKGFKEIGIAELDE